MSNPSADPYPRPDFERAHLNWHSLNGPWAFLFDDADLGLSSKWHLTGLPAKSSTKPETSNENNDRDQKEYSKTNITVPFAFQAPASGITEKGAHEILWYERSITDIRTKEELERGERLLVRFGAVDYEATVWLDGAYVGGHRGGHVPFEIDLSDAFELRPGNAATGTIERRLTVRIRDSPSDLAQPRGKQYWGPEPESIFYTPSSGIWQSVWLESVPTTRIGDGSAGTILRSNDIDSGKLFARVAVAGKRAGQKYSVEVESSFKGVAVGKQREEFSEIDSVELEVDMRVPSDKINDLSQQAAIPHDDSSCWRDGVALWSPEHPSLYDLKLRLYDAHDNLLDEITTTTGMRSLDWTSGDRTLRLNDKPYFQALVLDQGYWPSTGLTPPSAAALKEDIELAKKMGFNGCRKHQKVEDPVFLYWADRLGYLVWGEMANAYAFGKAYVERFDEEWIESVRRDINHPCIVAWTPVNESWGYPSLGGDVEQRNHIRSLYYRTKTLDPTRPINDNCGWEHIQTDLTTFHDYGDSNHISRRCASLHELIHNQGDRTLYIGSPSVSDSSSDGSNSDAGSANNKNSNEQDDTFEYLTSMPILCTEFGGLNIAPAEGQQAGKRDWGYITASDADDLLKRVEDLCLGIVKEGFVCGFVYTQLTDIEQEVNGLYSFDRKEKLKAERVKGIIDEAIKVYHDAIAKTAGKGEEKDDEKQGEEVGKDKKNLLQKIFSGKT